MKFAFGGDTGITYEELQRRRSMADALMAPGPAPRNVGEGLAYMGRMLGGGLASRSLNKREGEAREEANAGWTANEPAVYAQLLGGGSQPAQTAAPSAAPYATPSASPSGNLPLMGDQGPTKAAAGIGQGIVETANAIGMDPTDLATIISYETGGTFDPVQAGPTTQWGQHKGLIQFGEPQAQQYGVDWNDPLGSQLGPDGAVARYFRENGWQPGMGLEDAYSIVNAGAPGRPGATDAQNGGAPGTVRDKVAGMNAHRAKAEAMLGAQAAPQQPQQPQQGVQVAQAGGVNPQLVQLLAGAAGNDFLDPGKRAIAAALLEQTIEQAAPMTPYQRAQLSAGAADDAESRRRWEAEHAVRLRQASQPSALAEQIAALEAAGKSPEEARLIATGAMPTPPDLPAEVREYQFYSQQERQAGREAMPYAQWRTGGSGRDIRNDPNGIPRYVDTAEPVFPGVAPADDRKTLTGPDGIPRYLDTGEPVFPGVTARPDKPSSMQEKIDLLTSQGVDRETATGIATGRLVVSRDPITGQAQVVDKATGQPVGQMPAGAPSWAITGDASQPLGPNNPPRSISPSALPPMGAPPNRQATADAARPGRPLAISNEPPHTEAQGKAQFGQPSRAGNLYERTGAATGVVSGAQELSSNTLGQLPGAMGDFFSFPNTTETRQAFTAATGDLIRAFSVNPRFPVAEMQRIREQLGVEPSVWTDPEAMQSRMVAIDAYLRNKLAAEQQAAVDTSLPADQRQAAIGTVRAIEQYLGLLGVPQDGQQQRQNGPQGGDVARPASERDYQALPPGSLYIAPDGTRRRKP